MSSPEGSSKICMGTEKGYDFTGRGRCMAPSERQAQSWNPRPLSGPHAKTLEDPLHGVGYID